VSYLFVVVVCLISSFALLVVRYSPSAISTYFYMVLVYLLLDDYEFDGFIVVHLVKLTVFVTAMRSMVICDATLSEFSGDSVHV